MSELDETIFEQYADHLERRATAIVARWTAALGIFGALLGSVLLTSWADWPVHGQEARLVILLGGVAGLVLGHSVGSTRALGFRLQAQLAQHQRQFELTTLARVEAAQQAARESVREPVPAPFVAPHVPAGVPPVTGPAPAPDPEPLLEQPLMEPLPEPLPAPILASVPVTVSLPAPPPASVPVTAPVIAPISAPAP